MGTRTVAIAGAGVLGRLLAWRLARAGHAVDVFDPAPGPGPRFGTFDATQHAAGFTAAGMLSPLAELEKEDPLKAQLVNLRYFSGMSMAEAAEVLGVSERTVHRHWQFARAWLKSRLGAPADPAG